MPVRKFRSVEEMEEVWRSPGDPDLYRAIAALWATGRRIYDARFPTGIHRRRSIEELDAATEEWNEANFRRHLARVQPDET